MSTVQSRSLNSLVQLKQRGQKGHAEVNISRRVYLTSSEDILLQYWLERNPVHTFDTYDYTLETHISHVIGWLSNF